MWFSLRISEQRAALTSDSIVFWREAMLGVVVVVGIKLVPLLIKEMASGGSDMEVNLRTLFDEDSLIFSDSVKVARCGLRFCSMI